jgi:hypothetical protein
MSSSDGSKMTSNTLQEYKTLVVGYLRRKEMERCRGDINALERLESTSDEDLLRKWLWLGTIGGSLLCFLLLPAVAGFLARFIPYILMEMLWTAVKAGMGLVVIMAALAIYFTVNCRQ